MKGLFVRNKVWWMRVTVNGRQYRRSTGTTDKKVAEKIYHKVNTDIAERKFFEVDEARQHTFDEMVEKFMKEHAPKREITTQVRYKVSLTHLKPYFSGMLLADITSKTISAYYQRRKDEEAAVATINREFDLISKAFNLAWKQWEWCKENPCQKVQKEPENNQVDRWLTNDEYQRLINASAGYLNGQLTDIILVALNTSMRQGEILNLKWQDIDLFRKIITVMKTKNKHPKTIPMNDTVYDILLRKRQGKVISISGYVFATENGTIIRARNLITAFDKAVAKAEIENFTFHCLRHTSATWMIQNGTDIYTVSKILGHKDIRTTARYAHHYPESLRPGVMILDKISTKLAQSDVNKLSDVSKSLILNTAPVAQKDRATVS
jgi:integrase